MNSRILSIGAGVIARKAIDDDYIAKAFEFAHAADPGAELYYNDYSNEGREKREKTIRLIRDLKKIGVRIDAVGIQSHFMTKYPGTPDTLDEAIKAYGAEGVKVMNDPDECRRREEALVRERDGLRTLMDNLPDLLYVKDAQSRFIFNNAACLRFLGAASQDEIRGKTDREVYPARIGDALYAEEQRIIRTGEALVSREELIVDAAGGEHWMTATKVPWRDSSGQVVGLVGMSRDITARKEAERKLQAQNALLEESVRSEHAAHQQLKQAQSQLVQSEKLAGLGQMVAGIAHEMNNPLAFVSNNVAVLQRDVTAVRDLLQLYREADVCLENHSPDLLRRVRESAERMDLDYTLDNLSELTARSREGLRRIQQIVNDLRDFARLDTSDLQEADLNAAVASTVNIVAAGAKGKGVKIEQSLGSISPVWCYPGKINQVVMNLLSNALDACSEGGRVAITTRFSAERVEIVVSDNGSGIDPAIRDRIFDPFFTTKPLGKGTGLGLSISYGIVRAHGGEISVESSPGRGTIFVVQLPIRRLDPRCS